MGHESILEPTRDMAIKVTRDIFFSEFNMRHVDPRQGPHKNFPSRSLKLVQN